MVSPFPSICNSRLRDFFARRYALHIPVQLWTDLAPKRDAFFPETVLTALLFFLHRWVSKGTPSRCGKPCSTRESLVWFLRPGKLPKGVSLWGVLESPSYCSKEHISLQEVQSPGRLICVEPLRQAVMWELRIVFIMGIQKEMGIQRGNTDSQNTGQSGSCHVLLLCPGTCEQPHKLASDPNSQES